MSTVTYHKTRQENARDSMGHYWIEVYKDDVLVEHIEYQGYSGYEMADEAFSLRNQYKKADGYVVRF